MNRNITTFAIAVCVFLPDAALGEQGVVNVGAEGAGDKDVVAEAGLERSDGAAAGTDMDGGDGEKPSATPEESDDISTTVAEASMHRGEEAASSSEAPSAWLRMSGRVAGSVRVSRKADGVVVADTRKGRRETIGLNLPPGGYEVVIETSQRRLDCSATLYPEQTLALDLTKCDAVDISRDEHGHRRVEKLFFEMGFGIMLERRDAYTDTLRKFGYDPWYYAPPFHFDFTVMYGLLRYLQLGLNLALLDRNELSSASVVFSWRTFRADLLVRGVLPLVDD